MLKSFYRSCYHYSEISGIKLGTLRFWNSTHESKLGICPSEKSAVTKNIFFQALEEEEKMTPEQLAIKNVGKQVNIVQISYYSVFESQTNLPTFTWSPKNMYAVWKASVEEP